MTDTLKRVAGPILVTNAAVTVYTVPGATTTSLTAIHVANETGTDATFTLSIGADGAGKRFYKDILVLANDVLDWTGLLILNAAEVVQVLSGTNNALTVILSGVEVA